MHSLFMPICTFDLSPTVTYVDKMPNPLIGVYARFKVEKNISR